MKSKFYTVLVFAGLVILALIAVNSTKEKRFNSFDAISFYEPSERGAVMNSAALYSAISAGRSASCPQTKMDIVTVPEAVHLVGRAFNSVFDSKYGVSTFPISAQGLGISVYDGKTYEESLENIPENERNAYKACYSLSIDSDTAKTVGPVKIGDLRINNDVKAKYFKLIAPFAFNFANVNTMEPTAISIVNTSGTMMITFENVANWYCAGDIEEDSTSQSSTGDIESDTTKWIKHAHNSIIGNSANAVVSSGSQNAVIGYGTSETTIEIKIWDEEVNDFIPASIYTLFEIESGN